MGGADTRLTKFSSVVGAAAAAAGSISFAVHGAKFNDSDLMILAHVTCCFALFLYRSAYMRAESSFAVSYAAYCFSSAFSHRCTYTLCPIWPNVYLISVDLLRLLCGPFFKLLSAKLWPIWKLHWLANFISFFG